MALKVVDGFDNYASPTVDMLQRSGFLQYQLYGNLAVSFSLSYVTGFEGDGKALRISGPGFLNAANAGEVVAVFAQRVASAFNGVRVFPETNSGLGLIFYDTTPIGGPTVQVSIFFNEANYSISTYRGAYWSGGTLLGVSANNVWTPNVFEYIEAWPVIDPSTGSVTVKVGGNVIAGCSVSGVNTRVTGNSWWDAMGVTPEHFVGGVGTTAIQIDDLYYADTTSDPGLYPNNSPIGDIHVYTRFPIGNNAVQWTPLANTNWQEVRETAMDSDASYNSAITAGLEDTFNFAALPGVVNNILAIQITGAYRKDDAGVHTLKQAIISGASESYGATYSLPNTEYTYYSDIFVLDPATAANWTILHANGMAAGYNLVS